jgi:hypothetical protein
MDILKVTSKVSTLGESLETILTLKGPLSSMFAEVVPQVAALFEQTATAVKLTLEEELYTLGFRIAYFESLVPLLRDVCEGFWIHVVRHTHAVCFRLTYNICFVKRISII